MSYMIAFAISFMLVAPPALYVAWWYFYRPSLRKLRFGAYAWILLYVVYGYWLFGFPEYDARWHYIAPLSIMLIIVFYPVFGLWDEHD